VNIFTKIKNKIFGHRPAADMARQAQANQTQQPSPVGGGAAGGGTATLQQPQAQQQAQQPVDVEQVLTQIATQKGNPDLNWRTSIVDLMKLLDLDSSLDNRKELATELGYSGAKDGSAEMNIWLHKAVMRELAKNGGKVPANLTD